MRQLHWLPVRWMSRIQAGILVYSSLSSLWCIWFPEFRRRLRSSTGRSQLFHGRTTPLPPGHGCGTVYQDICVMRTLRSLTSGMNSKHCWFKASGRRWLQCYVDFVARYKGRNPLGELQRVHEKTITLDNVRYKCQIWMHPNQIACAWLWIYLRQNCQIS